MPALLKQPFLTPSLPEQKKIAECLTEMDNLVSAQAQKVDALKEKKKGLMQQLFPQPGQTTPKLRFPGFTGDWEEKKLGEVFSRLTEKNVEDNKNVLTISAQYGLISQLDFFKKSVSAADVTGYYLLHKGDFAYNKSSSQGKPVGAIKPLKLYDKGVVSTLYICFRCKDSNAIGFWEQYFDAGILDKEIMSIAQEGARNHGLLNVPTSDFFELKVLMPKTSEQQKIAEFLTALDEQIAAESAKVDALKDHKKGLMQQLFPQTGK
jgi:type I restriction enzyme S subunit